MAGNTIKHMQAAQRLYSLSPSGVDQRWSIWIVRNQDGSATIVQEMLSRKKMLDNETIKNENDSEQSAYEAALKIAWKMYQKQIDNGWHEDILHADQVV